MPGYIGFTPQFNPISLQDYLTVPMMVLNEYNKAEEQYNETANKAEALKALLGERNADNEAGWQIVDKYEGLIKDAADAMAATGIQGPEGYRQAKKAGTYYRQNMLPLESGINALQTDEKELRARDKDGTLVRKRRYSLNDYIKNPNLRSDSVLGSSIQDEAMKAAATASARKKTEPIWGKAGGNQYHSITTLTGFSPEEVQNWMLYRKTKPDKVSPELNEIYNQIATKFTDAGYDIRDIDDYITRGIYDGITYDNKIEYKENKQWALDHIASSSTDKEDDLTEDEILFPTALRPASFGRTDLGDKKGNFAVVNSDGSLSAKRGDELLDAFGIPKSEQRYSFTDSAGQKHYKEHKFTQEERIAKLFDKDGKLNTSYTKNSKITGSKEKDLYVNQLKEFGFDFNQSFNSPDQDVVITEGTLPWKQTQRLETIKGNTDKQRFANLENALQNLYQTSSEGISNSMYTIIPTNYDPKTIQTMIGKTNYNDWHVFEGMTRDDKGNLTPKLDKNISKTDVLSTYNASLQADNVPTADIIPGSNFVIVDLHEKKNKKQYVIPLNRFDPNFSEDYSYSHEQLNAANIKLQNLYNNYLENAQEYMNNPTETNRKRTLLAHKKYKEYKSKVDHIGDLYMSGLTKSRADEMSGRNMNTEKFSTQLQAIGNKVIN